MNQLFIPIYALAVLAVVQGADVRYVAHSCDVIAVGEVTTRTESVTSVSFDIHVQRVLKGLAVSGPLHVSHLWTPHPEVRVQGPSVATINSPIEGIWCLQPGVSASWDVHAISGPDGFFGSLFWPAVAALPAVYQKPNAALPDTLLFELAAGIEASGANPELAIGAAQGAQDSSLQFVANRFATLPAPDFDIAGLAGKLPIDPSALSTVSAIWPSISANPQRFQVVFAIREAFRDPAPSSIRRLIELASISQELREAVVHAVSSIHTKESLPFLTTLLTSPDASERGRGIFGLSSFANQCPAQTPANVVSMAYLTQCTNHGPYSTPETIGNYGSPATLGEAVSFWINWWNQNQATILAH